MKKAGDTGKAAQYLTRSQAIRRLQLSLHDFRRLCILKGVYPRIPKSRKKAQKGDSRIRTLYYKKDIRFLMHEPIIWKFREHKIYLNKIKKYKGKKDLENAHRVEDNNRPTYDLAHIVRERYPTFIDALGDLDDALSLNFLYAALPRQHRTHSDMHTLCRRLCIEWMHYIMESRSLTKVFVSIKGYYYQAEILGQTITWVVPHPFAPHGASDVDFRIMNTFCEFYIALFGFVNCRLYHKLNMYYPPTLNTDPDRRRQEGLTIVSEVVASLNVTLKRRNNNDNNNEEDDSAGMDTHLLDDQNAVGEALEELKRKAAHKKLFDGAKFFLGRETNRESLAFVIRSVGGQVSWDASASEGSTYPETDETITHQIVDRGTKAGFEKKYLSRYYLQPQWVYDCVNSGVLLPMQRYFPGANLPPHLSPFVTEEHPEGGGYVPPEQRYIQLLQEGKEVEEEKEEESEDEEPMNEDNEDEEEEEEVDVNKERETEMKDGGESDMNEEEEEESENEDELEVENMLEELEDNEDDGEINEEEKSSKDEEKDIPAHAKNMGVRRGKRMGEHEYGTTNKFDKEAERFRIMMIPKKRKQIYNRLKREETKDGMKKKTLERKREKLDKDEKIQNKLDKAAAIKKEEKVKRKEEALIQKKKEKKQLSKEKKAQSKAAEICE